VLKDAVIGRGAVAVAVGGGGGGGGAVGGGGGGGGCNKKECLEVVGGGGMGGCVPKEESFKPNCWAIIGFIKTSTL
jgi:hypothetical protein